MKPDWEAGLRGRLYALGRRAVPLSWRRALRRRMRPERLFGLRKPGVDLEWSAADPGPPRPGRADVLVLPVIAWSYRRQRPQQLAAALARRGRRVFYGSLVGSGEPDEPVGVGPGVTLLPIGGVRREDPADRRLDRRALGAAVEGLERARSRFGIGDADVLVQSPYWAPLSAELQRRLGWRVVYDCLDAHEGFSTNRPGVLEAAERDLVSDADLVLATSEPLRRRLAAGNADTRLLPNACDFGPFSGIPAPAPRSGALTVGYVGAVDEWFDLDLVGDLARLRPRWTIEIVGGIEGVGLDVPRRGNLVFRGERPYREMPEYHAHFDAEMIPFRLSPLTHATDPVKLYEAAAAGRGVVATPMESLEPFARRGLARLAATAADFARELEAAAAGGEAQALRLREFARENTWDARAETLVAWLTAARGRGTVPSENGRLKPDSPTR
jgi:glycosyltransferase involved in cell wall biosynthesis